MHSSGYGYNSDQNVGSFLKKSPRKNRALIQRKSGTLSTRNLALRFLLDKSPIFPRVFFQKRPHILFIQKKNLALYPQGIQRLLQHTAGDCDTLQHTATHCNALHNESGTSSFQRICMYKYVYIYVYMYAFTHTQTHKQTDTKCLYIYGVATISKLLKITGLFCRISSVLQGSYAKETYNLKEPTNRSQPIFAGLPDRRQPHSHCSRQQHTAPTATHRNTLHHTAA